MSTWTSSPGPPVSSASSPPMPEASLARTSGTISRMSSSTACCALYRVKYFMFWFCTTPRYRPKNTAICRNPSPYHTSMAGLSGSSAKPKSGNCINRNLEYFSPSSRGSKYESAAMARSAPPTLSSSLEFALAARVTITGPFLPSFAARAARACSASSRASRNSFSTFSSSALRARSSSSGSMPRIELRLSSTSLLSLVFSSPSTARAATPRRLTKPPTRIASRRTARGATVALADAPARTATPRVSPRARDAGAEKAMVAMTSSSRDVRFAPCCEAWTVVRR